PTGTHTVSVKGFGYRPVTRSITVTDRARVTLHVSLSSIATMLSGVVTTATGKELRRAVGGDIVVIDVDSVRNIAPIITITDILETRVPGLMVFRESGLAGAPARLRLRGSPSLATSNDPIVI